MTKRFKNNLDLIETLFPKTMEPKSKYLGLISLGKQLPPMPEELQTPKNKVYGCQSDLYLHTYEKQGLIYFHSDSNALISKGLAAVLIKAYQGTPIETPFKQSPDFLKELGIYDSLSFNRSSGLSHIYLKMQQQAVLLLKYIDIK